MSNTLSKISHIVFSRLKQSTIVDFYQSLIDTVYRELCLPRVQGSCALVQGSCALLQGSCALVDGDYHKRVRFLPRFQIARQLNDHTWFCAGLPHLR